MNRVQVHRMLMFVEQCDDPDKLLGIARNAAANGVDELQRAAKLKLFAILPREKPGTLEHDVWQSIHALEDALSEERGKTTRLSRTRQKIGRQGEQDCVRDLVLGAKSEGFRMLADRDMLQLSFEAVALRHPKRFDDDALRAARDRLREGGYEVG